MMAVEAAGTLAEVLAVRARDTPDALASVAGGDRLTWSAWFERARRAAAALREAGVQRGSHVALVLPSSTAFLAAFIGAQLLGAVPVAIRKSLPASQRERRLRELACRAVVIDPAGQDPGALRDIGVHSIAPDDLRAATPLPPSAIPWPDPAGLSHLQVTSGTSGEPRAAMLSHANVLANVRTAREALQATPADVFVGWVPLYHDLGLVRFVLEPLFIGCATFLIEPSIAALKTWVSTIAGVRGTVTAAPDFAYRLVPRLVEAGRLDIRSLRTATNGGEAVRLSTIRAFEQHFGIPGIVRPGYGLAEATLGVSMLSIGDPLDVDPTGAVTCGRALPLVAVRIVGDDGAPRRPGEPGRILVSGPTVFAGYFDDAAGTSAVVRDGWLDTGDDGALAADGSLFVHGRRRAMIKRAGASIAPREIEEAVDDIAGVRRSAAVGLRSTPASATEDVIVVVEVERAATPERREAMTREVADRVRDAIGFAPADVRLVEPNVIPRTANGKTQYSALKARLTPAGAEPRAAGEAS